MVLSLHVYVLDSVAPFLSRSPHHDSDSFGENHVLERLFVLVESLGTFRLQSVPRLDHVPHHHRRVSEVLDLDLVGQKQPLDLDSFQTGNVLEFYLERHFFVDVAFRQELRKPCPWVRIGLVVFRAWVSGHLQHHAVLSG